MKNRRKGNFSWEIIREISHIEYSKWIHDPRMMIFIMFYIFLYEYLIGVLLAAAEQMDAGLMLLEPFIAMTNSELLMIVLPSVYIVLMSDFPKTDGNTLFYIHRAGKLNWLMGQLFFGIKACLTYIFGTAFISFVLVAHKAYAKNMWSPVVTLYSTLYPEKSKSRIALLINGRLYNNMTPVQAFLLTTTFLFLFLMVIQLLLMFGFSIGKRISGIVSGYLLIAIGSGLILADYEEGWLFPSAHSIAWLHFDPVLNVQNVDIRLSYGYFVVLVVLLFVACRIMIRRYDFSKVTDMED